MSVRGYLRHPTLRGDAIVELDPQAVKRAVRVARAPLALTRAAKESQRPLDSLHDLPHADFGGIPRQPDATAATTCGLDQPRAG